MAKVKDKTLESLAQSPPKSLWRDRQANQWSFYCPLCKASRKLPFRPAPGARQFLQVGVTAAFVTLVLWPWLKWKGFVSFLPIWMGFELFYRTRVRAAISCPHCGFDPFLYLVDVQKAKQEIENYWRAKFKEKGIPYPEKGNPKPPARPESPEMGVQEEKTQLDRDPN